MQLGHSGRKGSTQLGWERMDHPLESGNWPVVSASPIPYYEGVSQVPREMTRADMDKVVARLRKSPPCFADQAGFDMLELHMAHGYLLASFISPLTNQRKDAVRRRDREPHAFPAGSVARLPRGVAEGKADVGAHLGDRLGAGRAVGRGPDGARRAC